MADIILRDNSGKIWKDTGGKIIKSKKFSENVIQNGLAFWGNSDIRNLTVVDGLVSEAYDIRGTGIKMIQPTVSKRMYYQNGIIGNNGLATISNLYKLNATWYSGFCVLKSYGNVTGLGNWTTDYTGAYDVLAGYSGGYCTRLNISYATSYIDGVKYTNTYAALNGKFRIVCSVTSASKINVTMFLGALQQANDWVEIKEWGWYSRPLTELEVIYNNNALNAKYSIF